MVDVIWRPGFSQNVSPPLDTLPYGMYGCRMKTTSIRNRKGAEQARQELPSILAAAAAGRSTLITRHGRPVAAVVPPSMAKTARPIPLTRLAGTGRGLWGANSRRTVDRLRDEWKS